MACATSNFISRVDYQRSLPGAHGVRFAIPRANNILCPALVTPITSQNVGSTQSTTLLPASTLGLLAAANCESSPSNSATSAERYGNRTPLPLSKDKSQD